MFKPMLVFYFVWMSFLNVALQTQIRITIDTSVKSISKIKPFTVFTRSEIRKSISSFHHCYYDVIPALWCSWWCWLGAPPPSWPCQTNSSWCPVATRSPRPPTEVGEYQTGNVAGPLSCNAPSETLSSAWSDHSLHAERGRRHQQRCRVTHCGPDRRRKRRRRPAPRHRGAGSACIGASGQNTW